MLMELIILAIILMIAFGILKWMMKISFRLFKIAIIILIILAILGFIFP